MGALCYYISCGATPGHVFTPISSTWWEIGEELMLPLRHVIFIHCVSPQLTFITNYVRSVSTQYVITE